MTPRTKRRILMAVPIIAVLASLLWLFHAPPRPFAVCHKGLNGFLEQYMAEKGTNAYPNAEGDSMKSLAMLMTVCDADHVHFIFPPLARPGHTWGTKDIDRIKQVFKEKGYVPAEECAYGYVPGLKPDDPPGLVLMYGKVRTRYRRHGDPETFAAWLRKPKWIIASVGFGESDPQCELNLWRDTSEFTHRLQATLAFLKANNRPHWEAVEREQTAFLNSIQEALLVGSWECYELTPQWSALQRTGALALLRSGPPSYVFDATGALVDWTDDRDEDRRFAGRWASPASRRKFTLDEAVMQIGKAGQHDGRP